MKLLELKCVSKSFFNNKVLSDVDFTLKAGEIHCIAGENGAGKSTVVKIVTGVYTDYTGEIFINGEAKFIDSPHTSRNAGIFAVQQHRDLVMTMNAVENMFQGNNILKPKSKSIDKKKMREIALRYLTDFNLEINLDVPISELNVLSKPGESHPELLLEPDVKVSLHPAPVIYAVGLRPISQW